MEREIVETLSTYIKRLEEAELNFQEGLLLARNVRIPVLVDGIENNVIKTPVGWPLLDYKMFYIVDVPAGVEIAPHKHEEDIFRVLLSGDLVINGHSINVGEWFVVKAGTTYSIETEGGYKAISAYTSICQTHRATATHVERNS